ncbi:site-specific integrase [Rhizobium herbae]|uniref:Integrase n=1 Tax=Rhizobium herbae TaxID=508661 RepID=A0ABS4EN67_9HYPH|nr:integrase [Rhizobium herbae]MBP1859376.1 integrase [Rhizobium herbae]
MAVRHEVENLIRRGNIFYWRPRIPAAFIHCRPGSRLSLSLHCSDHRKAQIIGRKLNTRLAELKMNSKDVMTAKKPLQILLEHVRDQELERLDDISTMAKRNGRGGDVVEMELDLEAGWACQLLAKFGTRSDLSFDGDCPGLAYLLKNGVPASHVDAIRANYLAELTIARSAGFEDGIRRLIYQFDVDDTAVNRERAMSKMFEGRAAALLDIDDRHELVDRTSSEFTGGGRANKSVVEEKPVEVEPGAAFSLGLAKKSQPAPTATDIPEPEEIAYLDLSPRVVPNAKTAAAKASQRVVAVADFEQACEKLIANMGEEWTTETGRDAMALVRMFKSVLMEHDVEHSGQIEQYHIGLLRQHFNDIPTNWGRSSKMRVMSAPELRAEGEKLRKAADAVGTKAKVGLASTTIRKHFGNLQHFLKHLKGHGFEIENWTFEGLRPRKPKAGDIRHQQYKPKPQDIAPIFSSPIYTGSQDHLRGKRRKPGKHVFHDSLYYLPILFTYLGPRRKEFAGLAVDDIAKDEDGYVILLRTNGIRRLKTAQSKRLLPMPDEMVRLGFLDYYQAIKGLGYEALFPDLFSDKTENDPGNRFYDTFIPVMRGALGEKMWERSIHALRHGMADTLKQAGVPTEVIDDISGRLSEGSETNTRYTNPAGLPLMRSALQHYPIITSIVERKPLQLLPWIENKQPPPWAREGKK